MVSRVFDKNVKAGKPPGWQTLMSVVICVALSITFHKASFAAHKHTGACSKTAKVAFRACNHEIKDDFWIAIGHCINLSDPEDREECRNEAKEERQEGLELCADQREARLELCGGLGEARYDPPFEPTNFTNPLAIGSSIAPNSFFPLIPGTKWVYEGGDETIIVMVTNETKQIAGVTCIVVNDVVEEDGTVIEDTDDWYAQDLAGNVWYCGEIAQNFELQEGEILPELVDIEGSWKAFRDGAKPGILMQASPQVGDVYRQEFSLGNAEDAAEVLSTTGSESVPAASCNDKCLITKDFTPIEPDVSEYKYYAPNVGLILEVDAETGARVELTQFTPGS